jgi:hypothetical protein
LTDEQKGNLLGKYYEALNNCAVFLKEIYSSNKFCRSMIVRRGNDSSTWNIAAGAWNKLRNGWFALVHALRMDPILDKMCPGKVLRLMAADVASWHESVGGDLHDDTDVYAELPHPWDVLSGNAVCTRDMVIDVCKKYGVDPKKGNWVDFKPGRRIAKFEATPELVHGISVSSGELAKVLRKAGVFSGKEIKIDKIEDILEVGIGAVVSSIVHKEEQEDRITSG